MSAFIVRKYQLHDERMGERMAIALCFMSITLCAGIDFEYFLHVIHCKDGSRFLQVCYNAACTHTNTHTHLDTQTPSDDSGLASQQASVANSEGMYVQQCRYIIRYSVHIICCMCVHVYV